MALNDRSSLFRICGAHNHRPESFKAQMPVFRTVHGPAVIEETCFPVIQDIPYILPKIIPFFLKGPVPDTVQFLLPRQKPVIHEIHMGASIHTGLFPFRDLHEPDSLIHAAFPEMFFYIRIIKSPICRAAAVFKP